MSTREEMIAHGRTVAEIAAELGCDSLAYLSLEGVYEAIRGSRERHCDACFTGEYPLAGTEGALGKYALELPVLSASCAECRSRGGSTARVGWPGTGVCAAIVGASSAR